MQSVDYIVNYLINEPNIEVEDIEDVLEDIMDQEFNTVCEDNSIKGNYSKLSIIVKGESYEK